MENITKSGMNRAHGGDLLFAWVMIAGAALAALSIALMTALAFSRTTVLQLVLPLRVLYSQDHAITDKGIIFLGKALDHTAWMFLLAACMTIVYAQIGIYSSARLPLHIMSHRSTSPAVLNGERRWVLAIMGIGLLLRTLQMNRGLCYDEMFTAHNFVNADSLWKTISTYVVFNNHIAYSICARFFQMGLGQSEWALRLPALLFGLVAIFSVWKFWRNFVGAGGALLAAMLLALFPLHIVYSELARGYTGMTVFILISSVFYLKLLTDAKKTDAFCYILASTAAVYFHLYSLLVIGVQVCMVLGLVVWQWMGAKEVVICRSSFRMLWISFFMVMIGCVVCYLPVAVSLGVYIQARGRGSFDPWFPLRVVDDLSGNPGVMMAIVMVMVALVGLRSLWRVHWRIAVYCGGILILPIMVVMGVRPSDLYTRFFIYFLPWYALLLSLGVLAIYRKSAALGRMAVVPVRLVLVMIPMVIGYCWISHVSWNFASGPFGGYIAPYRAVGQAMLSQMGSNVCLCAVGEGCEELSYYARQKLKVPRDLNELKEYIKNYDEVRCAYNVTIWDTLEQREMAQFLNVNGKVEHFPESRPCQEVVLFTIQGGL